jgi:hypothetical protein
MFSLFRRKRDAAEDASSDAERAETRAYHHDRIPDAAALVAYLSLGDDGPPVAVELLDMNIQGAGLSMPFHLAPTTASDQYYELTVSHARDGWRVSTFSRVTRVQKLDEQRVHVGLQFVNLGDLYAQLDDALGRYFNRRTNLRLQPGEGQAVTLRVAYKHHRLRGVAHDVSRSGVGVRMSFVQAANFKTGEQVLLTLGLPGSDGPLETPASVRHGYRLEEDVVLGIEFEHDEQSSLHARRKELHAYLAERERALLALQKQLMRR